MTTGGQDEHAGWTGQRGAAETWAQFDALPRGVKRLYWEAPYSYTARGAFRAFVAGADMKAKCLATRAAMMRDVAREALRLYGPEHPQARSSRAAR